MDFVADDFAAIAKAMKPSAYDSPKEQPPKEKQFYTIPEDMLKDVVALFKELDETMLEVLRPYHYQPKK